MKNYLHVFENNVLSRSEMANIKGGQCYHRRNNGNVETCDGSADCQNAIDWGMSTNWCCQSCSTATWCQGGQCPQI